MVTPQLKCYRSVARLDMSSLLTIPYSGLVALVITLRSFIIIFSTWVSSVFVDGETVFSGDEVPLVGESPLEGVGGTGREKPSGWGTSL